MRENIYICKKSHIIWERTSTLNAQNSGERQAWLIFLYDICLIINNLHNILTSTSNCSVKTCEQKPLAWKCHSSPISCGRRASSCLSNRSNRLTRNSSSELMKLWMQKQLQRCCSQCSAWQVLDCISWCMSCAVAEYDVEGTQPKHAHHNQGNATCLCIRWH